MPEKVVSSISSVITILNLLSFLYSSQPSLSLSIANRPASIVTPIPGTTRDVLELTLDIGGLPVVVADTAGLRETDDLVEGIGVQRGVEASVFFSSPSCSILIKSTYH
jgi:predicted GTPase